MGVISMTKKEILNKLDKSMLFYMNHVIGIYADSPVLIQRTMQKCLGLVDSAYILDVITFEDKLIIDEQLYNLAYPL